MYQLINRYLKIIFNDESAARRRFPGSLGSAVSAETSSSARWMKITFRWDSKMSRNKSEPTVKAYNPIGGNYFDEIMYWQMNIFLQ